MKFIEADLWWAQCGFIVSFMSQLNNAPMELKLAEQFLDFFDISRDCLSFIFITIGVESVALSREHTHSISNNLILEILFGEDNFPAWWLHTFWHQEVLEHVRDDIGFGRDVRVWIWIPKDDSNGRRSADH